MNMNQAEFLLLARTGRGPYSARAGPQPFGLPEPPLPPQRPGRRLRGRSGLSLRRGAGSGLRHGLGPRADRSARISRPPQYADLEYLELEFAVGFPAEEETLL